MKPCNKANVWGVIEKFNTELTSHEKKPFIKAVIDCRHTKYGTVRALCLIWGEDIVANFKQSCKTGSEIRLIGGLQQYKGKQGKLQTTFNIFRFIVDSIPERKANFVLVGEVDELDGERLDLLIMHPGTETRSAREENITVHLPQAVLLRMDKTPEEGDLVSVKGYLMRQEDEWGEETDPQRPVVKELKIVEKDIIE